MGLAYFEIVQLALAVAPDCVAQIVGLAYDSQGLVGVIVVQVHAMFAFGHDDAPHLDIDVLLTVSFGLSHGVDC